MTMRELCWAAEGRQWHDWNQTAELLWITAELNRDRKKRPTPFHPRDFHPLMRRKGSDVIKVPISVLKRFVPNASKR